MKLMVIVFGLLVGISSVILSLRVERQVQNKIRDVSDKHLYISRIKKEISSWEKLRKSPGIPLSEAFKVCVNDLNGLARVHGAMLMLNFEEASGDRLLSGARESLWKGVKRLKVQAVFNGINSYAQLLALAQALDAFVGNGSVMFQQVTVEKDRVKVDLNIMGVTV